MRSSAHKVLARLTTLWPLVGPHESGGSSLRQVGLVNVMVRSGWSADLEDLLGLLILVGLLGLAVYTDARKSSFAS